MRIQLFHSPEQTPPKISTLDAKGIEALFEHLAMNLENEDPVEAVRWVINQLNSEQIATLNPEDYAEKARQFHAESSYQCSLLDAKDSSQMVGVGLKNIYDGLFALVDSYLSSFGLADMFNAPEDEHHANMRLWKFQTTFTMFGGITVFLSKVLPESTPVFPLVAGMIFLLASLELAYIKFLKPMPWQLPHSENWSYQARENSLSHVQGRREVVEELAEALIGKNRHPMLVGKTGGGKTATVKALTYAIERGDFPELKGKQIYYINMGEVVGKEKDHHAHDTVLKKISKLMGRHRDNMILVFDEIHLACQKGENGYIGEELKTLLDPGKFNFPYVVGITTEEEYTRDIDGKNSAFARRFHKISLEDMSDQETTHVVGSLIASEHPKVLIGPKTLSDWVEKTKEAFPEDPQPYMSLELLSQTLHKIGSSQKSPLDQKIEECRTEMKAASVAALVAAERGESRELVDRVGKMEELQSEKKSEAEKRGKVDSLLGKRVAVKQALYRLVKKVGGVAKKSFSLAGRKELLVLGMLQGKFLPKLVDRILRDAEAAEVHVELTHEILAQVIGEEKQRREQFQETLSGK